MQSLADQRGGKANKYINIKRIIIVKKYKLTSNLGHKACEWDS